MKNRTITYTLLALAGIVTIYTGYWFWMAEQINRKIVNIAAQIEKRNIQIEGNAPEIKGFPGAHTITLSGKLHKDGTTITVPALILKGHFLPGQNIALTIPDGLRVKENAKPEIVILDYFHILTTIPSPVPADATVEALRAWRKAEGQIDIQDITIQKETLEMKGHGTLSLDEKLQPTGQITVHLTGHMAFLAFLEEHKMIKPKEAMLTSAVLSGMSQQDNDGKRYMDVTVTLQNQNLLVGPIRLLKVPKIQWPYNTPPARLQ